MRTILILLAIILTCNTAEAKRYRHNVAYPPQSMFTFMEATAHQSEEHSTRYISHPAGCPHVAFCGCGLSVHFFGHPVRSLYLASEWGRRFTEAFAAPGMAAVRRGGHHVFGLLHHIHGDIWMVWDANSGGNRTRIHPRSIRGYKIVNPQQPKTRFATN